MRPPPAVTQDIYRETEAADRPEPSSPIPADTPSVHTNISPQCSAPAPAAPPAAPRLGPFASYGHLRNPPHQLPPHLLQQPPTRQKQDSEHDQPKRTPQLVHNAGEIKPHHRQ